MTKLEEEMFSKLKRSRFSTSFKGATQGNITIEQAKAVAEVAKKYIEKAWDDGLITGEVAFEDKRSRVWIEGEKQEWLKENGII